MTAQTENLDRDKNNALKMRGDTALAVLESLRATLVREIGVIDQLLASVDIFDRQVGLKVGDKASPQDEMLIALRKAMPDLAHLSDDDLRKRFNGE